MKLLLKVLTVIICLPALSSLSISAESGNNSDPSGKTDKNSSFVVWSSPPGIAVGHHSRPSTTDSILSLNLEAAINEYESVAINITNMSKVPHEFKLSTSLPGLVGRPRSGLNVSIQKYADLEKRKLLRHKRTTTPFYISTGSIPDREDGLAMPLIELNESQTVFVLPGRTRQIWFTILTRDMKAGQSNHVIKVEQLSGEKRTVTLKTKLTVWDFTLSTEAPIGVFSFDYAGDYQVLRDYKINIWFRSAFPGKPFMLKKDGTLGNYKTDIDRVIRRRKEGAEKFLFSYGYTYDFIKWAKKNKIEYMSARWQELFAEILSRLIREWKDAGLGYDDFVLQTIDEAHDDLVDQVIETTPLIRKVDPKVRTGMTIMTTLADLKRMAPHVDVWITRGGAIWGKDKLDFFAQERAKGKPIWSWSMPLAMKSKPLTDFRTYGWRAMKFDFDAIGFFVYSDTVYDPFRPGGGYSTRQWEAWRDGVEDYQYLWELRRLIRQLKGKSYPAVKTAETLLNQAVNQVITPACFPKNTNATHEAIQQARRSIAHEILKLQTLKGEN
ncbi:MAG: hypothetical protein ACYTFY_08410 [Planctomycetota bacterium]|jgi:hypothetical protein